MFANSRGAILIERERMRQLNEEGFTPDHDKQWGNGQLTKAAICYLYTAMQIMFPVWMWPFGANWYKPGSGYEKTLVKAGALIAAEIDRANYARQGDLGPHGKI